MLTHVGGPMVEVAPVGSPLTFVIAKSWRLPVWFRIVTVYVAVLPAATGSGLWALNVTVIVPTVERTVSVCVVVGLARATILAVSVGEPATVS